MFNDELKFEQELIKKLIKKGWSSEVLKYKTEQELIDNWAKILFQNNRGRDKLNGYPLTQTEMSQLISQIKSLRTPHKLNSFINSKTVSLIRDNADDVEHLGKEVYLKIYDRAEIAGGQSVYQIVEQPKFSVKKDSMYPQRRGDIMLLINGMPLIHIELKKEGIPVTQAVYQIQKYSKEGVFTGLFSLIQIFVAMNPNDMMYFTNPGPDGEFKKEYQFRWADFDNIVMKKWDEICEHFLSIPMAHQLIGFYTVADDKDNSLKVLRSYQYYAVQEINKVIAQTKWDDNHSEKGGYIWHTTGSGKTMTSFKAAQLIANSTEVDKVVFLMDRIELGTQTLDEYRGFADDSETVNGTESTNVLLSKLKSDDIDDTLIVSSIQKMSLIKEDASSNSSDLEKINKKKIVIIVDECHRSTFGDMLGSIKSTFNKAIFFGFSGTPIQEENKKNESTTTDVFGNELHRYTIADGIRDKNVLGFDPSIHMTFKEKDLRREIGLHEAKAKDEIEALSNPEKAIIYNNFMFTKKMAGYIDNNGKYEKGIEDYIPNSQYLEDNHKEEVVKNILSNWNMFSRLNKFHAIFATSSIYEAINYYKLFKDYNGKYGNPKINIAGLFDPNIDNNEGFEYKEDGLVELLTDYNNTFHQNFNLATFDLYKKQLCKRLAHKKPYCGIEKNHNEVIDLVIVVDQLLTGFDSKWINTLYLDKMLKNEHIIQAFSRTNRLFDSNEKPHGIIIMFRRPYTMVKRMNDALDIYSGNKPFGVFVDKLEKNLNKLNNQFIIIKDIFESCNMENFERLPDDVIAKGKFAKEFKIFQSLLNSSLIQGMTWKKNKYQFTHENENTEVILLITEAEYISILQRYKELFSSHGPAVSDVPFDIDTSIIEIRTDTIDSEYLDSKFKKFIKVKQSGNCVDTEKALNDLHKSFSTLTQEEQRFANIIIHDIHTGVLIIDGSKAFMDYIYEYQNQAKEDQISKFADAFNLAQSEFRTFVKNADRNNINEYGKLDILKSHMDKQHFKKYLKEKYGIELSIPQLSIKIDKLIYDFIETDGFDIDEVVSHW